ncbi:hypothetical protein HYDPIDRAFT_33872 [Hydnomerulius pinastri MD-312]|uniref:Uncharacterized protein n=1 Tax=Hydnomerulius pinastri MD-312 TaxID=994086 RepID=A0A0C9W847_9AGAM|nr:hypothetical protein HYDPIDRAFT_33872 [Hydnomerulius pinastri MD-312]
MLSESELDVMVNLLAETVGMVPGEELSWAECLILLTSIVEHSAGKLDPGYASTRTALMLIKGELKEELIKQLNDAWKARSYQSIRNLEMLQRRPPLLEAGNRAEQDDWSYGVQAEATKRSWEREYVGEAADALWDHIQDHVKERPGDDPNARQTQSRPTPPPQYYAQCAAIIQSSGTGKSRAVDEMSKSRFVIPINLRDETATGYPPRDASVCSYFAVGAITTQKEAFSRACAFLQALFETTKDVLSGDITSPQDLAKLDKAQPAPAQFRSYMEAGMSHKAHGEFRRKFYEVVCSRAFQLISDYKIQLDTLMGHIGAPSENGIERKFMRDDFPLKTAFQSLCKALEDFKASRPPAGEPPKKKTKTAKGVSEADHLESPFVIISFDEIHALMQVKTSADSKVFFSVFGELQRALRHLLHLSFFALFLTTTGKFNAIMPPPGRDLSSRIQHGGRRLIPPFVDLGLDQVAKKVSIYTGSVTLSSVSSSDQLCTYGRPLWGTRYEAGKREIKDNIVSFAASKLLGGQDYKPEEEVDLSSKLACLATRLPIEFLSTSYASHAEEMKQVEGHLRLVLRVDENMESMVTVSPSEPVLSEAAYWIMQNPRFNLPGALTEILRGFSVHKGDRGELLVMLLFTMARDAAVGPANSLGRPIGGDRTCLLTGLLRSLFCLPMPSKENDHIDVLKSPGRNLTPTGAFQYNKLLETVFANSVVYFNHFVKVHQYKLVHINYLMCMMVRGAAMLCVTDQPGIDGILPFLLDGDTIKPSNIGVVLWQVKNDSSFKDDPDLDLFDAMDPYRIGIFTSETKVPIIRIVFALASKKPCLKTVKCAGAKKLPFVTYDFWVAGLDKNILAPTGEEPNIWDVLLQGSHGWKDVYEAGSTRAKALRQSGNPAAADGKGHWIQWLEVEEGLSPRNRDALRQIIDICKTAVQLTGFAEWLHAPDPLSSHTSLLTGTCKSERAFDVCLAVVPDLAAAVPSTNQSVMVILRSRTSVLSYLRSIRPSCDLCCCYSTSTLSSF